MGMPAMRHHWSAEQVRALIDQSPTHWPRYELMRGELIVTPAPGGLHQVAVVAILALLTEYLRREPVGVALTSPADIQLHPDTVAQPDIFVAPRKPQSRSLITSSPGPISRRCSWPSRSFRRAAARPTV
jgi:Uma2 family endonuclease